MATKPVKDAKEAVATRKSSPKVAAPVAAPPKPKRAAAPAGNGAGKTPRAATSPANGEKADKKPASKMRTLRQVVELPAPPRDVYLAFVDPRIHASFTGALATGEPRVSGNFTAWDGYISGKHLVLEREKRIVQEWSTTEWPEGAPPSLLELTFEETREGTTVTMVHSDVPASQANDYASGWKEFYWVPLRAYLEKKR